MRKLLGVISLVCICLGIINAVHIFNGYKKGRDEYRTLKEIYTIQAFDKETERTSEKTTKKESGLSIPADAPKWSSVDLKSLREVSINVVAWIEIPGIAASYPVMQGDDNAYYLHRDINGDYLFAGSIFMDAYNDPNMRNMNTIIYGHNMNDRSMFGRLREYRDQEFFEAEPYFWIYTEETSYLYQIFSVHPAIDGSAAFIVRFLDAKSFESWIMKMKEASEVSSAMVPDSTDQIVTLSTCTGNNSEKLVVQGVLISEVKDDQVTRLR